MKITAVKLYTMHIPLITPFKTALRTVDAIDDLIVVLETDDGQRGFGEAPPTAVITGDTIPSVAGGITQFIAPKLIGREVEKFDELHDIIDKAMVHNTTAKAAVEMAVYDLLGKRWNVPLYKLLGGAKCELETDITISVNDVDTMVRDAVTASERGFRILKVKTGLDLATDIRALTLIRNAVGPDVRIRIDANQGYSVETALKALPEFEKLGIDAAEQFLPWWDFEGAAELKRKNTTSVKLMLDESIHNIHDAHRAAKLDCADFYNIKLMKCGGLYYGAQIADIAEEAGVGCMVGCMQENKISIAAGVSLVAAKKAIVEADCDSFMFYKGDDDGIAGGFTREGGVFTLLDKPGLGLDYDI